MTDTDFTMKDMCLKQCISPMDYRYEYPFQSRYATIDGIRLHYLDEGEGPVIWLMHGNTSWSYLYRKMIPRLVKAGFRCFVPDLMGFGLSDIPTKASAYSLSRHISLMSSLIHQLQLKNIVPVGQDWGGPISLRYAIEHPDNIRALVVLNTFIERFPASRRERAKRGIITSCLPPGFSLLFKNGIVSQFLIKRMDVFRKFVWLRWRKGNPSKRLGAGFRRPVDPRVMENYLHIHNLPQKRTSLACFADMIPNNVNHPNSDCIDDIRNALSQWQIPAQVIWSDGDLAWKVEEGENIARIIPNAQFYLVKNAGHFLQEDAGEEIADVIINFLNTITDRQKEPISKT